MTATPSLSYGPSPVLRVACQLFIVGFIVTAALLLLWAAKPWGNRLGAAAFALVGVAFTYLIGLRSGVEVDATSVRVRTLLGTTVNFPLSDLDHASGGVVLTLHRRSGNVVLVRAVASTNITALAGRSGRSERVASEINAFLNEERRPDPAAPGQAPG